MKGLLFFLYFKKVSDICQTSGYCFFPKCF